MLTEHETSFVKPAWGQFPPFHYFPNFSVSPNTCELWSITCIFDGCHRSWAAMTPDKYECDSKNLTCTSAGSTILLEENLMDSALVPHPPHLWCFLFAWKRSLCHYPVTLYSQTNRTWGNSECHGNPWHWSRGNCGDYHWWVPCCIWHHWWSWFRTQPMCLTSNVAVQTGVEPMLSIEPICLCDSPVLNINQKLP